MYDGGLIAVGASVVVSLIAAAASLIVRRTREATAMTDAWDRIDALTIGQERLRVSQRITEDGFDALYRWHRRARERWNRDPQPPEFTGDEDRAIRRARQSLEIADTTEITIPK